LHERAGLLEEAKGGTLFLDEIGDLSPSSQIKLLRLLESKEYIPLGADRPKKTDARFIAATNKDLSVIVKDGSFRKDLYYRLCTHRVYIPPLRERMCDVPLIFDHILTEVSKELNKKKPKVPKEVFALLCMYNFPGNVRELRSLVYNALSTHKKGILSTSCFAHILTANTDECTGQEKTFDFLKKQDMEFVCQIPTLKEAEKLLISEAMHLANDNQSIAAKILGISRQALNQRLHKNR
jgi:transcriptional regulator with PAS, ATPase and Fis domain